MHKSELGQDNWLKPLFLLVQCPGKSSSTNSGLPKSELKRKGSSRKSKGKCASQAQQPQVSNQDSERSCFQLIPEHPSGETLSPVYNEPYTALVHQQHPAIPPLHLDVKNVRRAEMKAQIQQGEILTCAGTGGSASLHCIQSKFWAAKLFPFFQGSLCNPNEAILICVTSFSGTNLSSLGTLGTGLGTDTSPGSWPCHLPSPPLDVTRADSKERIKKLRFYQLNNSPW